MSGTLLSINLSLRWAHSGSRSFKVRRSRKGQTDNFGFVRRDTCFWVSFSSTTPKMTLEHFLNGPNRTKFENRKNADIAETNVKMTVFDLQNAKFRAFFQLIYLTFCTRIHKTGPCHIYSSFFNSKIFPECFENNILC